MELCSHGPFVFSLPSACTQCGSILSTIPSQDLPISLVRSRYVPSATDVSVIRGLISSSKAAIRTLEAELCIFQSRLSNIRAFNAFHRTLLSPIRRLPDELLNNIFTYLVCEKAINVGIGHDPIWTLQQVCVRWRNVVQDSPLLWNNFKVENMEVTSGAIKRRIRSCLEFSGNTALSISFLPISRNIDRIFEDIANHADRIFSLAIYIGAIRDEVEHTASVISKELTQLQTLTIFGANFWDAKPHCLSFRNATALEDVKLKCLNMSDVSELRWTKVKRLIMDGSSIRDPTGFKFLLRSMSHLEELTWSNNWVPSSSWNIPEDLITLPTLHTLNVSDGLHECLIWPSIRVPHLSNFRIRNVRHENLNTYLDMIQESGSVIQKLHLSSCLTDPILMIIGRLRDVEELSIFEVEPWHYPSDILRHLIWDCLHNFPYLRKFDIRFKNGSDPSAIANLQLILESRSSVSTGRNDPVPVPMTSVKCVAEVLEGSYGGYMKVFNQMKDCGKKLGVDVEVEVLICSDSDDEADSEDYDRDDVVFGDVGWW